MSKILNKIDGTDDFMYRPLYMASDDVAEVFAMKFPVSDLYINKDGSVQYAALYIGHAYAYDMWCDLVVRFSYEFGFNTEEERQDFLFKAKYLPEARIKS